jgi:hypothetical protein
MTNKNDLYIYDVSHPQVDGNATFFVSSISKEESRKHLDKMLFHEASPANGHLYDVNLIATVVNKFLQDSTKGSGIVGATTTGDFGS